MKYTMSDARAFTDYRPSCDINKQLQQTYGTVDIHAYRHFLQTNAEKVMADTRIEAGKCTKCPICEASLKYKPSGDILKQ